MTTQPTAAELKANIARNLSVAEAMQNKASDSCSYGSDAYVQALENAKDALRQVTEDRAALAALAGNKVATFRAIFCDYALEDAAKYVDTFGSNLCVVAVYAEQLTGDKDGFNDWVATVIYRDATPAEAYAARHNGSLCGYRPVKKSKTRRQYKRELSAATWGRERDRINSEREVRNAQVRASNTAGEINQNVALPPLPIRAVYLVKGIAVLKALLANHSYPSRRIIAQLFTRPIETPKAKRCNNIVERQANLEAIRYFKRFTAPNALK